MRITFLCSSLEPGRDGVGDYTRLLAVECERRGATCSMIALHDRHLKTASSELGSGDSSNILSLRLAFSTDWGDRVRLATEFLNRFHPDWVSLQFVPYGFHDKGIIAGLPARLREILHGMPRVHFMAHELWIGAAESAPVKDRTIGAIQKHYIGQLLRILHPRLVTTSNAAYAAMLARLGISATILPLFGNIPINAAAPPAGQQLDAVLRKHGIDRTISWIGVFFGTIHPQWTPEPTIPALLAGAKANCKAVCLVSVGRLSAPGENMWESLEKNYGKQIRFVNLGELPPSQISSVLAGADFGIATSPWELIGKSGSAAAMIDHGLPVLAGRDDWHLRGEVRPVGMNNPLLYHLDDKSGEILRSGLPKSAPASQLTKVAANFLDDLASSH